MQFYMVIFQILSDFRIKLTLNATAPLIRYVNDLCEDWLTSAQQ